MSLIPGSSEGLLKLLKREYVLLRNLFRQTYFLYIKSRLGKVIHFKRAAFAVTAYLFIMVSLFVWQFNRLNHFIYETSPIVKGQYTEGIVGPVGTINPIFYSGSGTEDVNKLVFSGLTKVENGVQIAGDLAESWKISDKGKTYTFRLRQNIKWHDGRPLTADDVIFTYERIINPQTHSTYQTYFKDVKLRKDNELTVTFMLPTALSSFLPSTTVGILPKHLLNYIEPQSLSTAIYNQTPIGSGPYKIAANNLDSTSEVKLELFEAYYGQKPYIPEITLKVYTQPGDLAPAFEYQQVDGISQMTVDEYKRFSQNQKINLHQIKTTNYVALFYNTTKPFLNEKPVRQAIGQAIDRQEIIRNSLSGYASIVYSPIPVGFLGFSSDIKFPGLNSNQTNQLLEDAGYKRGADGIREKNGQKMTLNLVTSNSVANKNTAQMLRSQLQKFGIELKITPISPATLQKENIRAKSYDLLLYGQNLGADSDVYSYWHSSQAVENGLNLSNWNNAKVDGLLEAARLNEDDAIRIGKYQEFQKIFADEVPASILYSPFYFYGVSRDVKVTLPTRLSVPSDRFQNISEWYTDTAKVKKK